MALDGATASVSTLQEKMLESDQTDHFVMTHVAIEWLDFA